MDYSLGSDLLFEILKCLERVPEKPFLSGSVARLTGFFWSYVCRDERPVSREFVALCEENRSRKCYRCSRAARYRCQR